VRARLRDVALPQPRFMVGRKNSTNSKPQMPAPPAGRRSSGRV
jgi:hypothetical protein